MGGLQQTTGSAPSARVDFDKKKFDDLIQQKGKVVIVEQALRCGCKSPASNALSNCRNCGGTGWMFVNPTETRMIMQSINLVNDFTPWSEENRGFVNISFNSDEDLSFMDKITDVNGRSTFTQTLFFKQAEDETIFTYTTYPIEKIKYVGLFKGGNNSHQKLVLNSDFTIERNIIRLINPSLIQGTPEETSISVRYKHSPVFHLVEMKRESMETFTLNDGAEVVKHMPLSAIARRAHYIPNIENLSGNRLLNNNYTEKKCNVYTPKKVMNPPIHKEFAETTADFIDIRLIGKAIMLFRNGVYDSNYELELTTGRVIPTIPYEAKEYIDIWIMGEAS